MNNIGFSPKLPLSNSKIHYDMIFDITENIRQNFKNLVLTSPGERIMIPDFGVGIRRFLFETNSPMVVADIEAELEDQIDKFMPFVVLDDILVRDKINGASTTEDQLALIIKYSVPELEISDQITVNS